MSDKLPDEAIATKEDAAKAEPSDETHVEEPALASNSANDKAKVDNQSKKLPSESSKQASDQDDDEDDEDDDEEEEVVKPKLKAKTKTTVVKKLPANAIVIVPTPPKKMSSATALIIAAVGLGAYWKGLQLYNDVQQDYYSHCAWLLLIGLICVTLSAFHFIGAGIRKAEEPAKKPAANAVAQDTKPSIGNVIVALLPALPFAGVYLSLWYLTWEQVWTKLYPNMAWLFFLALGLVSWGAYLGLKPPTEKEEQEFKMPDRRVTMLVVLPFVLVFGMIWFASAK